MVPFLNKADRCPAEEREALQAEFPTALVMSALDSSDTTNLRTRIVEFFRQELVEVTLTLPYARMGALAELRDQLEIVSEDFGETMTITVRGTESVLAKLAARVRANDVERN